MRCFTLLPHAVCALALQLLACSSDEPEPTTPKSEATAGAEHHEEPSPVQNAKHNIDEAHQDFKQAVKPAGEWVDEKTGEVVEEGKRAFRKVTGSEQEQDSSKQEAAPAAPTTPAAPAAPAAPESPAQ